MISKIIKWLKLCTKKTRLNYKKGSINLQLYKSCKLFKQAILPKT